ncbi:hypothetical protein BOG92_002860 [Streptomyces sp. WAC00263]|nr:hypothetical protein BOG92_002860 [Streptomyces sp. WAC00263]
MFFAGWDLLGARELKPERRIDSKTLFDLVKLSPCEGGLSPPSHQLRNTPRTPEPCTSGLVSGPEPQPLASVLPRSGSNRSQ